MKYAYVLTWFRHPDDMEVVGVFDTAEGAQEGARDYIKQSWTGTITWNEVPQFDHWDGSMAGLPNSGFEIQKHRVWP